MPKDLEAICLACLEPDPARRLADAGLLADALRQFLDTLVTLFQCSRCSKAIKSKKALQVGTTVVRCPHCGAQSLVEPLRGKAPASRRQWRRVTTRLFRAGPSRAASLHPGLLTL